MITDKVGGSSAKPEVSKQSKEKRPKHKESGYKSQSKRRSIARCRLLLRTLHNYFIKLTMSNINSLYLISNIVHSQLLSISCLHLYKQLWQNNRPWNWDYPKEIRMTINCLKQCTNLLMEININYYSYFNRIKLMVTRLKVDSFL